MPKKIEKIVIVGGGSAGWMSAAHLAVAMQDRGVEIVVVDSPNIPIVGVGESTLGQIRNWTHALGIDERDFMSKTNASYKMSIKFTDFYNKDSGSFHYPFGNPVFTDAPEGLQEWLAKKIIYPDTPVQDYARTFYPVMPLVENNKYTPNEFGELDGFRSDLSVAYHFDSALFGQWLRTDFAMPKGVKNIQQTVVDIQVDENGIKHLELENGDIVTADLFIDCTGWKSLLLAGALKEPFVSWEDKLPNNKAWAVQIPYKEKEKELEPYTNCTAINNGWVWNIPLWSRLGTGYVYSDKFISDEDAKEEFKQYLMSNKVTVPRSKEEVDSFEYRNITMRVGIHERTWVKNVVAIGLSAGFIEPLESNGLFTVHEFLSNLVNTLEREYVNQWDKDVYNAGCLGMYNNFAEFVCLHYALSVRDDTPYWKSVSNKTFDPTMVNRTPSINSGFAELANRKLINFAHTDQGGIHCIATGMNYLVLHKQNMLFAQNHRSVDPKIHCDEFIFRRKFLTDKWQAIADKSPTLYQWLKDNIYGV
jgi:tryptophan halogenase